MRVSSVVFVCSVLLFCEYGDVYCCEIRIYVLFCISVWVCADVCCVYLVCI